jgi:hypothetical protein
LFPASTLSVIIKHIILSVSMLKAIMMSVLLAGVNVPALILW